MLSITLSFHESMGEFVSQTLGFKVVCIKKCHNQKSFGISVNSEKYAFWVTFRLLGYIRQGKDKLHTLIY